MGLPSFTISIHANTQDNQSYTTQESMVGVGPRKPPSRKGSMRNLPRDLLEEIKHLDSVFSLSTEMLKKIVDNFVNELDRGLSKEGGDIV